MNPMSSHSTSFVPEGKPLPGRMLDKMLPLLAPVLARVGRRLPTSFVSAHFVAALETARLGGWLLPPAALEGQTFAITVEDLGLDFFFTCHKARFRPLWQRSPRAGDMDLRVAANCADFASLVQGEVDADTLFFQRRLKIAGDTSLGLIVKNWLDSVERPQWLVRREEG
jgi:predicted lipid carrier protein YhbT